jgi:hypothetical protein
METGATCAVGGMVTRATTSVNKYYNKRIETNRLVPCFSGILRQELNIMPILLRLLGVLLSVVLLLLLWMFHVV